MISVQDFKTNPHWIFAAHELAAIVDPDMATKMTVQFNLFGGTVLKLGTEVQKMFQILEKKNSKKLILIFIGIFDFFYQFTTNLCYTLTSSRKYFELVINYD